MEKEPDMSPELKQAIKRLKMKKLILKEYLIEKGELN